MRADTGCDVGLAVPALVALAGDRSVELRRRVWRALRYATDVIARGLADPDADVVGHARVIQDRLVTV